MSEVSSTNWAKTARGFKWNKDFSSSLEGSFLNGDITWFKEGELNICENLLDRHVQNGLGDKTAFIWEANDINVKEKTYSYSQSLSEVSKFANALKKSGVQKGDVIAIYMPMVPEAVFASLACSRIGAVHTIVFGGFSKDALRSRLIDSKTKLVITAKTCSRGQKEIDLLGVAQEASKDLDHLTDLIYVNNCDKQITDYDSFKQTSYENFVKGESEDCPPTYVEAEHPLFILYTSGSTGKPKGLVHTTGGYMVWASFTFKEVFQFNSQEDVFWCTADIGWITGHSYFLYGPFLNGATQVMFEGVPTYPNPDRFWKVVEKFKVTHFYTAPTAIRSLQSLGDDWVLNTDLSSLKVLGSVGEPINVEAWQWYHDVVGQKKCEIVDTWWQTETGGVMISNIPGKTKAKPCLATKPLTGINPVLLNQNAELITDNNKEGILCISEPWPGIARTILNDHQRYLDTYMKPFPNFYYTGDGAKRDSEGDYRIIGRIDDVVNVSGHRIGTAEVEDVINKSGLVIESAVVGIPDDTTGQALLAFGIVASEDSSEELQEKVNQAIKEKIGSFSKVKRFIIVQDLPKTRSGKIMRRLLRKVATKDKNFGDISTLLNPDCVSEIQKSF